MRLKAGPHDFCCFIVSPAFNLIRCAVTIFSMLGYVYRYNYLKVIICISLITPEVEHM